MCAREGSLSPSLSLCLIVSVLRSRSYTIQVLKTKQNKQKQKKPLTVVLNFTWIVQLTCWLNDVRLCDKVRIGDNDLMDVVGYDTLTVVFPAVKLLDVAYVPDLAVNLFPLITAYKQGIGFITEDEMAEEVVQYVGLL